VPFAVLEWGRDKGGWLTGCPLFKPRGMLVFTGVNMLRRGNNVWGAEHGQGSTDLQKQTRENRENGRCHEAEKKSVNCVASTGEISGV